MHLDEELKSKDTLGDRMKRYEDEALSNNMRVDKYVMIRLDGCHFHTWVKKAGIKRPFDERMIEAMQQTTLTLCENVNTCVLGYCQSDEISLLLKKGESEKSEPWFSNRVQKLCSTTAGICSVAFNDAIRKTIPDAPLAYFDSRVMFMPDLDECINCFIWRQNDCIKNSVAALAQSMFSPKELLNKHQDEQIEMMLKNNVNWYDLSTVKKLGTTVHKIRKEGEWNGEKYYRGVFIIDTETPRFTADKKFLADAYNFSVDSSLLNEAMKYYKPTDLKVTYEKEN